MFCNGGMRDKKLLEVENLTIEVSKDNYSHPIVKDCSFSISKNEILGVVGESGSGKSITSLALMGLLSPKVFTITKGSIFFNDRDLLSLKEKEFRAIRGKEIAMIFQEPMSALNPTITCGKQVAEILEAHFPKLTSSDVKEEVISLFSKVKLPNPLELYDKYPHEISGGQKQRVMIAMAIACKPLLLIADEPTTALDVTVQKEIIQLLKEIQQDTGMSILFISHDLGLVSSISDYVLVMYKGEIVEKGNSREVFGSPKEQYTKALISSRPSMDIRLKRLPTIDDFINQSIPSEEVTTEQRKVDHQKMYASLPLLEVKHVSKDYITKRSLFHKGFFRALDDVSFAVYEGETLGLVGESGCGKSTLGNAILQLDKATAGQIFYKGVDITLLKGKDLRLLRKEIQIVFQDPYSSLNPKITVGDTIIEPMKVHKIGKNNRERKEKVVELLNRVGLNEEAFNKYPHEFSGGQRQRIGIARSIAMQPKLIVCDESVSALDISVQAQVLNLLNELKEDYKFTYIFISHDLAVVKYMSDNIIVMNKGKIEELAEADLLYEAPQKEYTKKLIQAIPK